MRRLKIVSFEATWLVIRRLPPIELPALPTRAHATERDPHQTAVRTRLIHSLLRSEGPHSRARTLHLPLLRERRPRANTVQCFAKT